MVAKNIVIRKILSQFQHHLSLLKNAGDTHFQFDVIIKCFVITAFKYHSNLFHFDVITI